jgi:hypothetical protein
MGPRNGQAILGPASGNPQGSGGNGMSVYTFTNGTWNFVSNEPSFFPMTANLIYGFAPYALDAGNVHQEYRSMNPARVGVNSWGDLSAFGGDPNAAITIDVIEDSTGV